MLRCSVLLTIMSVAVEAQDTTARDSVSTEIVRNMRIRVFIRSGARPPVPARKPFKDARGVIVHDDTTMYVGTVVAVAPSFVRMTPVDRKPRKPFVIPAADIARIERSMGQPYHTYLGAFAGVMAGAALGYAAGPDCSGQLICIDTRPLWALMGALGGAAAGAVIGHAVSPAEKWREVSLPSAR